MKKIKLKRFIFFCNLIIFSSQFVSAQNRRQEIEIPEIVFTGNHFAFNFSALFSFKARLRQTSGRHSANTTPTSGGLIGFKYQVNFNNYYSLIMGPEATVVGRNFNTSFYKNDFSPPLENDYSYNGRKTYRGDFILSLPITVEKRFLYKKEKYFFVDAGLQLNVSTGADIDISSFYVGDINNNFYNVAEVNVYANNDAKPWISFPLNAGHAWFLKNNNVLHIAIISNISFTKYVNGRYQVTIPNQSVTEGKYSSTGSYIGLSLNYLFTSANYRIQKQYEKNRDN